MERTPEKELEHMGLEHLCPYVITPLWDSVSSSVQKDGEGIKEGPASGLLSLGSLSNKKAIKDLAAFSPAWEGNSPAGSRSRLSHPLSVLSCLSKRADLKLSERTTSPDEKYKSQMIAMYQLKQGQ